MIDNLFGLALIGSVIIGYIAQKKEWKIVDIFQTLVLVMRLRVLTLVIDPGFFQSEVACLNNQMGKGGTTLC